MARPGRHFNNLFHNAEKREQVFRSYIHHRNLYTKGNGEFGFVWDIIKPQNMMITWLFLRDLWPQTPIWVVVVGFPLFILLKLVVKWLLGWYWDRHSLFDEERNWANQRDPMAKRINDKLLGQEGITWQSPS
jgi:hypothetical protein